MARMNEIERNLERDRQAVAASLMELRHRLSPGELVAEGKQALVSASGPMVARMDKALRGKPVVAAVAGVALAALVFGRRSNGEDDAPAIAGTKYEALTRWEGEGGPPMDEPPDLEEPWMKEARGLRANARRILKQIDAAARRGSAPAAELARHRADVTAALARDTRAALMKGLEPLGTAARDQAILARERMYLARIAAEEKARAQVEEHPLMTGAIVAGAGAMLGYLFPQSETEDRLMGEARDGLVDEVKSVIKRETLKASDMAKMLSQAFSSDVDRARSFVGRGSTPARHH